jgi:hypothetical protein
MKKTILTIIFAFILINVKAQAPNWAWARGAGGTSPDFCYNTATDVNGNVYITGKFSSPTITFGAFTLTNNGGGWSDIFIVKYDPNGNVLWAKSEGDSYGEKANSITTDTVGNVIITGEFDSNSITFGSTTLFNNGSRNIFIAKYNALGGFMWAKSSSVNSSSLPEDPKVATDASGNIYITGYCFSSLSFGTINLPNALYTAMMFLAKYDAFGNLIWAKKESSTKNTQSYAICTDALGHIYVTGRYFSPNITFGTTILTNSDTTGNTPDMFLVKYNSSGNVIWAKGAGNIGYDIGMAVATDKLKNVVVSGEFSSPITFGSTTLNNVDFRDLFIVKYDDSGNPIWAKGAGGLGYDQGNSLNIDNLNNIYLSGIYTSNSITFGATTLYNSGNYYNVFIAQYNDFGSPIWAKSAGSTGIDFGQSAIDQLGNVYLGGTYKYASTINFDTTTLVNEDSLGNYEAVFIAKLGNFANGITQINNPNELSVYPNPNDGKFIVQHSSILLKSYVIYNMVGVNVLSHKSNLTNQFNIDLSTQPKGIYFIEITDINNNYLNKKIIIQ